MWTVSYFLRWLTTIFEWEQFKFKLGRGDYCSTFWALPAFSRFFDRSTCLRILLLSILHIHSPFQLNKKSSSWFLKARWDRNAVPGLDRRPRFRKRFSVPGAPISGRCDATSGPRGRLNLLAAPPSGRVWSFSHHRPGRRRRRRRCVRSEGAGRRPCRRSVHPRQGEGAAVLATLSDLIPECVANPAAFTSRFERPATLLRDLHLFILVGILPRRLVSWTTSVFGCLFYSL